MKVIFSGIGSRLRVSVVTVLLAGTAVLLGTGSAGAQTWAPTVSSGAVNIVSEISDRCVDIANYGTSNLDRAQQWDCHEPQTQNQSWHFENAPGVSYQENGLAYDVDEIVEDGTNECLEALNWGVNDRTVVDIYNCAPIQQPHGNQLWIVNQATGDIWNYGATIDRGSHITLDVVCEASTGYAQNNGAALQLYQQNTRAECYGDNEKWTW